MAEVVVGEKVTLEEMGGARMHCTVSGCGDVLVADEDAGIGAARRYLEYLPQSWHEAPPVADAGGVEAGCEDITNVIPAEASKGYDVMAIIRGVIDDGSFFEIKRLFAREIVCGFARIDGHAVGVLASQPRFKGGVLFVDSADKATRFITCCDAFNVPLLFLADVPGFMIGTAVERQGIIRHGAKMICRARAGSGPADLGGAAQGIRRRAVRDERTRVRARLHARPADRADRGDGPRGRDQRRLLQQDPGCRRGGRAAYVKALQDEYRDDIDIFRLASELIVDAVVPPEELRAELVRRFACYRSRRRADVARHHPVAAGLSGPAARDRDQHRSVRLADQSRLLRGRALCRHREPRRSPPRRDHADHGRGVRRGDRISCRSSG